MRVPEALAHAPARVASYSGPASRVVAHAAFVMLWVLRALDTARGTLHHAAARNQLPAIRSVAVSSNLSIIQSYA